MAKQVLILVLLSLLAILLKTQLLYLLHALLYFHNQVAAWMALIFSDDSTGQLIQGIVSLAVIPILSGGIVALVFWLMKRQSIPHMMTAIWVVWTVLLVTMLAQAG